MKEILISTVNKIIDKNITAKKIQEIYEKHRQKTHFIPIRYRVLGGLLQSINIQFGNFIEEFLKELIKRNDDLELIEKFQKNNTFFISFETEKLIDEYISVSTEKSRSEAELKKDFDRLLTEINQNETTITSDLIKTKHDVDLLFRSKKDNTIYLVEIKYNDDHDTGKFVNINRKVIKTYAYIKRFFPNDKVVPILFYFTNKISKGNIYIPEQSNIYRGSKFFSTFLNIDYNEIDNYFLSISESPEVISSFDNLYHKVIIYDEKRKY